ncbi:short-chain dehydrogenase/reductase family 9C member 7-like, partial [Oppia nitens]|uniref:short-chain dehydrogenase/reductase family 9C member 7-like n=1 Tax=Oppia nitens TaxID=1686743 RepID=UPI0023DCB9C2
IFLALYIIAKLFHYFKPKQFISSYGKAVLITGCDSGFGNLLAYSLNERGFRVYATCLDPDGDGGQGLTKNSRFTDQMVVLKMNVTDDDNVRQVYKQVTDDLNENKCQLWSVVNNAGYMITSPVEWGLLADYEHLFDVNVFGVVRVTRVFLPLLRVSKGRIVNMSSTMGRLILDNYSAYCMTKASVLVFSNALRLEMQRFGIRVATIMPGAFKTTGLFAATIASMDNICLNTDQSVKSAYGQQYYQQWKQQTTNELVSKILVGTDSSIVVNDMIDAVMNTVPRNNYEPIGSLAFQVFYRLNNILGKNLLIKLFSLF